VTTKNAIITQPRVAFLFLLAIAISMLLFWVVEGFILPVLLAAILAGEWFADGIGGFILPVLLAAILSGMLQPVYRRILEWTGGRQSLAAALTVVLSLVGGHHSVTTVARYHQ
jgi:predicted PurR-regulated permease PerM